MKILNDKYYTSKKLAKELIDITFEVLTNEGYSITDIIEPSAGSGSFSNQINCTAYDIEPEDENIIKCDFLKEPIEYKKGRLCIGNPPFGNRNSLSIKFFKKCCIIGDYIAFIQPISKQCSSLEYDLSAYLNERINALLRHDDITYNMIIKVLSDYRVG
ncbi:MAG: hypothetical protein ACI30H_03360 [Paludibacteraceae bacterium]